MPGDVTPNHFSAVKITLIEDDESVRRGVSRLLRSEGFVCTAYPSGEAALADPDIGRADCLILDIQLPGMNGFEIRDRLEARGLLPPVIFVTAHSEISSPEWQSLLKGSCWLRKPFEAKDLMGTIRRLL